MLTPPKMLLFITTETGLTNLETLGVKLMEKTPLLTPLSMLITSDMELLAVVLILTQMEMAHNPFLNIEETHTTDRVIEFIEYLSLSFNHIVHVMFFDFNLVFFSGFFC